MATEFDFPNLAPYQAAAAQRALEISRINPIEDAIKRSRENAVLRDEALSRQLAAEIQRANLQRLQRPQTFEVGGSLIMEDPSSPTGYKTVFTAPSKATPNLFETQAGMLERLPSGEVVNRFPFQQKPVNGITDKPITLSPGQQLRSATGELIAENTTTSDKPTIVPANASVLDAQGKVLFQNNKSSSTEPTPVYNPQNPTQLLGYNINGTFKNIKDFQAPTAEASQEIEMERAQRNLDTISELKTSVSPFTTGLGSLLSNIPGTNARDFNAKVDTLKANIAFGELQEMRDASKTGGALGAIAVRELELLESTLGSLDTGQSGKSFLNNLGKIEKSINSFKEAQKKYSTPQQQNAPAPVSTGRKVGRFTIGQPL